MTSKRTAASKRATLPRAVDYASSNKNSHPATCRSWQSDWPRSSIAGHANLRRQFVAVGRKRLAANTYQVKVNFFTFFQGLRNVPRHGQVINGLAA
jgi:hypothetical protein